MQLNTPEQYCESLDQAVKLAAEKMPIRSRRVASYAGLKPSEASSYEEMTVSMKEWRRLKKRRNLL